MPHGVEFQLACNVLLGIHFGRNQERWMSWWKENKKTYELAPALP